MPDASRFTRFKQDFKSDLQLFFDPLVDITKPICQGIEAYVTENNPKYAHKISSQLKAYKKSAKLPDSYDPQKVTYKLMPPHSASNPAIKQLYITGHFCYVYKFDLTTNGLGIVRDISFYDKDFIAEHPDIIIEKKSDFPDEDKSLGDAKALIPVLTDF